jgi:serine protease
MLRGGVFRRTGLRGVTVRRFAWVILAMSAAVAVAAMVSGFERNPVRRHPTASPATAGTQHIIVKLRAAPAAQDGGEGRTAEHLTALAARTGLTLEGYRPITTAMHVMRVSDPAGGSAEEVLGRLRADPEVQYADPDQRAYIHLVPNDSLYPANALTGYVGQWNLMPNSAVTPSAIDAQTAWNTTTGSASLVIADIDTGVRADHPDLAGRLLPGYCFISDPFVANNGTCPGSDDSDPGDWVTPADITNHPNQCGGETIPKGKPYLPSSWHGTRVAGVLGALTNNNLGVGGVTWSGQILPVRALGTCGGLVSDIVSGMLWAAGLPVALANGQPAPANPHPANIINLSIGGSGTCAASYQDVINQITALGVLIVVSAGNESGPVDQPANCSGVAAVAGLRHVGSKVGYSNVGPGMAVAAPAGNCVNTPSATLPCVYSITTTTNLGATAPDANDYTGDFYCDPTTGPNANCPLALNKDGTYHQYRTWNVGTSFSAPQVSGIGALMMSVNRKLNSCQLISRIKASALPFPQSSATTTAICPNADPNTGECICTNDGQTCGAGMANANGAVAAALRPIAAVAVPSSVTAGQTVQLSGSGSAAAPNHTLATFDWAHTGGESLTIQNANTATASVTVPSCGLSTLTLTVTDTAGLKDTAQVVVSPTAVTSTAPAAAGVMACSSTAPAIEVAVCPASASVQTGATQALSATLANTTDTAVTWQVNGIDGGNSVIGTVSSTGVYTAPASVPTGGSVTVTATSVADSGATASTQLAITSPGSGGGGGGGALEWLTLVVSAAAVGRRYRSRTPGLRPRAENPLS